jgi:hypothetical protein
MQLSRPKSTIDPMKFPALPSPGSTASARNIFPRCATVLLLTMAALSTLPVHADEKKPAEAAEAAKASPKAIDLFNGKDLHGWKVTNYAGHGPVEVESLDGSPAIVLEPGISLTGLTWTNEVPSGSYEISLEAQRVNGSDFFCGLTFPVNDTFCTFVVGGWGGALVGISSINGFDASDNETTDHMFFEKGRWYKIRVQVTPERIQAWIDDERTVNLPTENRRISMRYGEIELSKPLGISAYQTRAALRNIRLQPLAAK